MWIAAFGQGLWLGIGAAAPIGPVNVEIARRTLRGGFSGGFFLGCGAVTVDVTYGTLVGIGFQPLLQYPPAMLTIGIIGAALLTWLGILSLRSARSDYHRELTPAASQSLGRNYLTGLAMTSLNPMTLVFWFSAVPASATGAARHLPFVVGGVLISTVAWVVFFTTLMMYAGRASKRRTLLIADLAGGIMLLVFAAWTIWRVVQRALS